MKNRLSRPGCLSWAVVFFLVAAAQLGLVAVAGTDIPFQDQWVVEGQWLYPAWLSGSLGPMDLLRPFNEHRILWTHLLNLGLFSADGQWDPLVQLVANAGLRAACATVVAWMLGRNLPDRGRLAVLGVVVMAFLPHLAWHNVLWGFESQVFFVLGFSLPALALLGTENRTKVQTVTGLALGTAALVAMAPGAFVPVLLLGLSALHLAERRASFPEWWRESWPALLLLVIALALWRTSPTQTELRATSVGSFLVPLGRALGWPHVAQPWAAFPLNLPLVVAVCGRLARRRQPVAGEDWVLLLAGWGVATAVAAAWTRGGGDEFAFGVPSRYVDFLVLLPLANAWLLVAWVRSAVPRWRASARGAAVAWSLFLLIGWLGLSVEVMRRLVLPRARDRDAPVRLVQEFQRTGDPAIFAGQPRLLVPHADSSVVLHVLVDPRLRGALPPSLQPSQPQGPLSRAVRKLLRREAAPAPLIRPDSSSEEKSGR